MKPIPQQVSTRSVYSNPYVDIKVDTVSLGDKQWEQVYFTKPNQDAVGIVAVENNGIYLVEQYRYPSQAYLWQIPMGMIDINSDELTTAKHELAEEIGLSADHFQKIGIFNPEPGMSPAKCHIYLATGLTKTSSHPESTEVGMNTKFFAFAEIEDGIKSGLIQCGFTLSAYLLYKLTAK